MADSDEKLDARAAMIMAESKGIYPVFEAFYIQSIIYAAERAESAFDGFDFAVAEAAPAEGIMGLMQEALTHAAALSRFFWPMGKTELAKARGQCLREAFDINDTSSLRQRKLRNAFEHFDEDLDRFLLGDRVGHFFPSPIVDDHALADDVLGNIFKLVDPTNGIRVLLGEKYEYLPLREEVRRVLAKAEGMDAQGGRLTPYEAQRR